jgi:maltose O-acetyltransferase
LTQNTDNFWWHLRVNRIAASHLLTFDRRMQILRRSGIDTRTRLIGPGCHFFSSDITLGPETWVNEGVYFENRARIEIGARCGVGYQAMLCTSAHDVGPAHQRWSHWKPGTIVIQDGSWVGARAVVMGPVTIGSGCIVAAGAVVVKDCEPNGLYAGVPARRVKELTVNG